jgi:hypothetical protein
MASKFYDWHFARSQNRMEQKPLFDNGIQVEKYHHKDGLVLTFLAVVSGKQISILLDKQDARYLRDNILAHYPTDEVERLRMALISIRSHAMQIGTDCGIPYYEEMIQAIVDTCNSWPKMRDQAADEVKKDEEIAALKKRIADMGDDARQLSGIEAWIGDTAMKRHCTKYLTRILNNRL